MDSSDDHGCRQENSEMDMYAVCVSTDPGENSKHLWRYTIKTESTRGPGRGDTCHLSNLDET